MSAVVSVSESPLIPVFAVSCDLAPDQMPQEPEYLREEFLHLAEQMTTGPAHYWVGSNDPAAGGVGDLGGYDEQVVEQSYE